MNAAARSAGIVDGPHMQQIKQDAYASCLIYDKFAAGTGRSSFDAHGVIH
jgi:hypothetical protein